MVDWVSLISSVGFPIAAFAGLALATWKAMVWAGARADKVIDRFLSHLDAVDTRLREFHCDASVLKCQQTDLSVNQVRK